jgi:putative endonuclease
MKSANRLEYWRFGRRAEALCVLTLRLKGYRILARDLRTSLGEIDIVARRGRVLAFVEVKARDVAVEADEALGRRQRGRIERAARTFLQGRPDLGHCELRFDIMLARPWRLPIHLADAWRSGE